MSYILISIIFFMSLILGLCIFAISKLTKMIYDIDEQIDDSLEILDNSYKSISKVLGTPVFYDDPLVKQTLQAIKRSQNAILLVANKISYYNIDIDEANEAIANEEER